MGLEFWGRRMVTMPWGHRFEILRQEDGNFKVCQICLGQVCLGYRERGLYAKFSGRAPAYTLAYVQGFKRSWGELYNEHFLRHFLLGVNGTVVWTFYSASSILIECLSIDIYIITVIHMLFYMCKYNMQRLYPGNWHIYHLTHYHFFVLGTVKILPTILKHTINCCQSQLLCCAQNSKVILPTELPNFCSIKQSPHN